MKLIAYMHLKRFCGDFMPLLDFPLTAPFFSRITHLGLARVSITTSPTAALCERLAQIPSLTHLAFDDPNIIPECRELFYKTVNHSASSCCLNSASGSNGGARNTSRCFRMTHGSSRWKNPGILASPPPPPT
ncbi:hypothetical protein B0H16DRAFT_1712770 [Mycena metata]|uniref:Uncharacterized protein n=1 Tax=Mycena metata TaxID=1033252 RepID=A0AAD7NV60_9AGAR|nr:hypothetical protein B0H16DRAFT_1712770 [Mycena metata]